MAFNAVGASAAACSELNPPQEIPLIPTAPLDQWLARQPGDHFERIVLFLLQILAEQHAVGVAEPRMSTRTNAKPYGTNISAQPVSRRRSKSRFRYGKYSQTTGTGAVSAPSGIQIRAASRVPSLSVTHSFSTSRKGRFGGSFHARAALDASAWTAPSDGRSIRPPHEPQRLPSPPPPRGACDHGPGLHQKFAS